MENPETKIFSRRSVIQNALLVATGGIGIPGLISEIALAQEVTRLSAGVQSWVIGNDWIKRVVCYKSGGGLFTCGLSDPATHAEFIASGKLRMGMAEEFSFDLDGHTYRGTDPGFQLLSADEAALPNGKSLTVRLRHKDINLEVSVVYSIYDGHPAIRKHLLLHNPGRTALRFTHLKIEALGLLLGPANEMTLKTQYGAIPREIFYTGRSEDAGLLVSNSRTGAGVAIISEVPGYMKRTEIAGWDDPERVRIGVLYDTDLMPFERSVAEGQEFKTASVSLITFQSGNGFHDPQWVLPSYTAKVLMRRVDGHGPPWIYNTWEPFVRGINREIALQLIEAAGAMGMDIFTIDDGWQQEYGENAVNLASFPGGLEPILDAVEARGMRLGLWIPLAAIGMTTADYRNHPEWASRDQAGKLKVTDTMGGSKVVMCLASAFRDSAADRINDAISRFRLAYVKLDLTTIFNAYGETPGCWAKGHDHGSWAESLNMIYEGIAYVTSKVYSKHPDVLLDLTFELWGQKHVIDAGLLAAGDLDWMSNVDDTEPDSAGPIQARQLLYQRAASMPVESMLIGNIHAELPTIQESFATAIGSAPLLLGDLRKLSVRDKEWYHEKISWFKGLRRKTQISESFFPLGSWLQTSSDKWDGFARLARSGDGIAALFRNKSGAAVVTVQLPLIPAGTYRVHSIMTGKDLGVFTKADWVRGVPIPFSASGLVDVLEITSI
jgi:alpha-galactosidase